MLKVLNTQDIQTHLTNSPQDHVTVVDCFTTWCAPCKAIKPVLDKLSTDLPNVSFLAVDIDNNPDFAKQNNVRSVPTLLFYKGNTLSHTSRGLQKDHQINDIINNL